MNGRSAWRLDDAAMHARMSETLLELRSALLVASLSTDVAGTQDEVRAWHRSAASIDGFDRTAVDNFTKALEMRLREVNGSQP